MKFYEKIIGLNKNAPSDELIITFSNSGFEFNRNIYLDEGKGISLSGGENAVISFRVGDPINIYKNLDSGTLTFASNGKNLDFDFGDQSGFNGGSIYAHDWSLGGLYSPLNSIYSTNGTFTNIESLSNNYLKLKAGTAEMTFEENSIEISSSLEVLGDITATNLYGATDFTNSEWTTLVVNSVVEDKMNLILGATYEIIFRMTANLYSQVYHLGIITFRDYPSNGTHIINFTQENNLVQFEIKEDGSILNSKYRTLPSGAWTPFLGFVLEYRRIH